VTLQTAAGSSGTISVPVSSVAPGIFFDAASGFGAILVNGTGQVAAARAAGAGEYLEVFGTALGPDPSKVQASIGGIPAQVLFGGLAPGSWG
jgi:hypothetical protein